MPGACSPGVEGLEFLDLGFGVGGFRGLGGPGFEIQGFRVQGLGLKKRRADDYRGEGRFSTSVNRELGVSDKSPYDPRPLNRWTQKPIDPILP